MDVEGLSWDDAWDITIQTCAYTNHTIMTEALEKWPVDIFARLLPRIYQIVEEINRRFVHDVREKFPNDEAKVARMSIIGDGNVRMANMAIVGSYSVNGVAALHTEILKKETLHDFYDMYPDHFSNKTNGVTQRRFLLHGNPELAEFITKKIGDGWITNLSEMKKLEKYATDAKTQKEFLEIKHHAKERLAKYIKEHNDVEVDPDSIFDVQVKRLHEYKRQMLNILHVMYLYNQMKEHPERNYVPRTFIFGAKASAGYHIAKLIIKLINSVAEVVNNDETIEGKLKVVFIEDYRVSNAEKIFAAADVSEQISTASKEASGTSNMKFMMNGAITIGTMDGATVEMVQEMGEENAVIFGMSADEVIAHEAANDYNPMEIYNEDGDIRKVVEQLVSGFYSPDDPELFRDIYNSLLNTFVTYRADIYFVLKDFRSYAEAQERIEELYEDSSKWAEMALKNIANVGKFSSDRTIQEYVDDIWHLDKIKVKL
jgi:starch phosphorylase